MMTLVKRGPHRMALSLSTRRRWRGLLLDWRWCGRRLALLLGLFGDGLEAGLALGQPVHQGLLVQAMTSNLSSLP